MATHHPRRPKGAVHDDHHRHDRARATSCAPEPSGDTELQNIATQFLALESKLLDEAREEEWYQLLDPELLYVIPIRQATEQRSDEVNRAAFRVRDTLAHVRLRIDRLSTGNAYSEIPPSRTMRLVGSVLARRRTETTSLRSRAPCCSIDSVGSIRTSTSSPTGATTNSASPLMGHDSCPGRSS